MNEWYIVLPVYWFADWYEFPRNTSASYWWVYGGLYSRVEKIAEVEKAKKKKTYN